MIPDHWVERFRIDEQALAKHERNESIIKGPIEIPGEFDDRLAAMSELDRAIVRAQLMGDIEFSRQAGIHKAREQLKRQLAEEELARLRSTQGQAELAAEFAKDVLTSSELDDIDLKTPLIENFIDQDSLVRIFGPPKSLKSFVALDMAGCIGAGVPWHGNATTKGCVLYVFAEGIRGARSRVRAWEARYGRPMEGVDFYPKAVQIGDEEDLRRLIAYTRASGCLLVIFDTQARCTIGVDENGNTEMGRIVSKLDVLREETGACAMLVHHSGIDGGRARGATGVLGALDAEFEVKRDPKDPTHVSLITKAQKDRAHAEDMELEIVEVNGSLALIEARGASAPPSVDVTDAQYPYLKALAKVGRIGASPTDLGKAVGKTRQAATPMLARLEVLGLVQPVKGTSRFTITAAGSHGASVYAEEEAKKGVPQGTLYEAQEGHQ